MKVRKDSGSPLVIHQGVAELGHELGNVLNGLLGMTRLVRDSGLNAEQEYWLRAIEQSGCQMRRLVEAFWLGPTPTGEFIHPNPVDLDGIELLEQALLAHAPAARRNADRLLLTVAPDVPRYWHCDPCLLRQLLDNLLGNALKFTRSGEVVLEVAARLQGNDPTDTLLLAVIDSGPGIDAALGRRMFRAYERGLDPGREDSAGYGLGLFICQRIVRALGGAIGWSSPAAGGVRFEVTLPGVLAAGPTRKTPLTTRILQSVECRIELPASLQRSVAGCLARLGVPWRLSEQDTAPALTGDSNRPGDSMDVEKLCISITEMQTAAGLPGPQLLLQAESDNGCLTGSKCLQAPFLECNLGPLLLELTLEWLWIRNEEPGSAP